MIKRTDQRIGEHDTVEPIFELVAYDDWRKDPPNFHTKIGIRSRLEKLAESKGEIFYEGKIQIFEGK